MYAEVRGYMTTDADPLDSVYPDDPENFRIDVEAAIGTKGSKGSDNFVFYVATAKYLESKFGDDAVFLRHYLLVKEWNPDVVKNRIEKLVSTTSGVDWGEIASKLSRYGYWEFEDIQPLKS